MRIVKVLFANGVDVPCGESRLTLLSEKRMAFDYAITDEGDHISIRLTDESRIKAGTKRGASDIVRVPITNVTYFIYADEPAEAPAPKAKGWPKGKPRKPAPEPAAE